MSEQYRAQQSVQRVEAVDEDLVGLQVEDLLVLFQLDGGHHQLLLVLDQAQLLARASAGLLWCS